MSIDVNCVGSEGAPVTASWTSKDCLLYALGVGAGNPDPLDELAFTTENSIGVTQRALPTFPIVIGALDASLMGKLGDFNRAMLVHAEQEIELHQPVPVEGTATGHSRITAIYDKGSGAVGIMEGTSVDPNGKPLWTTRTSVFIRGEGGFGGDRGPSGGSTTPTTEPNRVVSYTTRPDQALLYRLSGDRNPLHADPTFAARGGFPKPILHGLCTYGVTGRALLHAVCGSDPDRFKAIKGRFTKPVMPGATLVVKIWTDGTDTAQFVTSVEGDSVLVGSLTYVPE